MRINRPQWDPSADHVVRGGDLLYAGESFPNGAEFPVTSENERKARKLFLMGRIVRAEELAPRPAPSATIAPAAAGTEQKPRRSRRSRAKRAR